jgi:hypothetical protein
MLGPVRASGYHTGHVTLVYGFPSKAFFYLLTAVSIAFVHKTHGHQQAACNFNFTLPANAACLAGPPGPARSARFNVSAPRERFLTQFRLDETEIKISAGVSRAKILSSPMVLDRLRSPPTRVWEFASTVCKTAKARIVCNLVFCQLFDHLLRFWANFRPTLLLPVTIAFFLKYTLSEAVVWGYKTNTISIIHFRYLEELYPSIVSP